MYDTINYIKYRKKVFKINQYTKITLDKSVYDSNRNYLLYAYLIPFILVTIQILLGFSSGTEDKYFNTFYFLHTALFMGYIISQLYILQNTIKNSLDNSIQNIRPSLLFYFTAVQVKQVKSYEEPLYKKNEFKTYTNALEEELANGKLDTKDFEMLPLIERILHLENFNIHKAHGVINSYLKNGSYERLNSLKLDNVSNLLSVFIFIFNLIIFTSYLIITHNFLYLIPFIIISYLTFKLVVFIENEKTMYSATNTYEDFKHYIETYNENISDDDLQYNDFSLNSLFYGLFYIKDKEELTDNEFLDFLEEFFIESYHEEEMEMKSNELT